MLFLSYARTDVEKVDEVFGDLDRANREPWRDLEMTGGLRWWDEILERIRSCDLFVFLLSPDSIGSRACRAELAYAEALDRPIVPVLVREMDLDMAPEQIAEMVVVDVRSRSAESTIELLNAIDSASRPAVDPDPLPAPPPVPLNELAPVADRLAEPSLSLAAQRGLVADLSSFGDVVEHRPKVAELAREMAVRPDLAAAVRDDLDRLIAAVDCESLGHDSVDAEELAQRADRVRSVLTYLRRSTFTPILGHGLTDSLIAPRRQIAHEWAETLDFPLSGPDRTNLAQVAQFVSVMNDPETLREMLRSYLIGRIGGHGQGDIALNSQLADLVRTAWREREVRREIDAQRVLAELDCPIYVNANPWGLLTEALEDAGKKPEVEVCRWRPDVYDWPESVFEREPSYRPTIECPLVFHVFGALSVPESTVITEDDYLDFMASVAADRSLVPLPVQNALADSSLLLLGFDLTELDTRVLLRTLVSQEGGRLHKYTHVAAQVDPESSAISPARAKQYLERNFGRGREPAMDLYWGSVDDFVRDIAAAGAGAAVA